jgi:Spy/CpxP family protein refolding chaperone
LTIRLTLTTAQQAQATTIFTTELAAEAALVAPKQAAKTALQAAITANSVSGIQAQAGALGALETQQIVADATADASFYAILTPAQQTTYNNYRLAEHD